MKTDVRFEHFSGVARVPKDSGRNANPIVEAGPRINPGSAYACRYEILVIDDGSPTPVFDFTHALGAAANQVNWIRIPTNRGLVNALNTGIVAARNFLVARLDADDVWFPTKIEKQLALFERDADLTITATGMSMVDTAGNAIAEHIRPGDWNGILRFFVETGCPFPHGSVLASRGVYRLLGGYSHNAGLSHCEDFALWGTWLRFFKPAMIEESLYGYTVSDTSVSAIHQEQQRNASHVVQRSFAKGDLVSRLPDALDKLSKCLGISMIEAGKLAYLIWHFKPDVALPSTALDALTVILFDREFSTVSANGSDVHWTTLLGLARNSSSDREVTGHFYAI